MGTCFLGWVMVHTLAAGGTDGAIHGAIRGAIIGGCVGGVVGLIGYLAKRKQGK